MCAKVKPTSRRNRTKRQPPQDVPRSPLHVQRSIHPTTPSPTQAYSLSPDTSSSSKLYDKVHTHTQLHGLGSLARSQKGAGKRMVGQESERPALPRMLFSSHNPNKHATLSCARLPPQEEHPCTDTRAKRRPGTAQKQHVPCARRAVSSFPSSVCPAERGKQSCTFQATSWVCVPAYDSSPLAGVRGCGHSPPSQLSSIYTYTPGLYTYMYIYILRMYR